MFRENFLSAGIAGLLAALVLTLLQAVWITPLILHAETYEDAATETPNISASAHEHGDEAAHTHALSHDHSAANAEHEHGHHHDASEWKPTEGLQRFLFTLASNIAMGVGYALLLIGVYTFWQRPNGTAQGLLFGLAGFAIFFVAPGLGLPPELPGTEAAELTLRQQWWLGTAAATAVGLALIFVQKNWILRALGVAFLIAPHLIGAPHLATETSLAPTELQNHFRLATTICNAVFWLLLGAISALALRKLANQTLAS
jgi:cobalt transporter subunit CbtA